MVILRNIEYEDYPFLYELLSEREDYANISHSEMPLYEEHVIFWARDPYQFSMLVVDDDFEGSGDTVRVGYIYITHRMNEVGLFIKKEFKNMGYGDSAMEILLGTKGTKLNILLANINPNNEVSKNFFKKHGFKELQHTYQRKKEKKLSNVTKIL